MFNRLKQVVLVEKILFIISYDQTRIKSRNKSNMRSGLTVTIVQTTVWLTRSKRTLYKKGETNKKFYRKKETINKPFNVYLSDVIKTFT